MRKRPTTRKVCIYCKQEFQARTDGKGLFCSVPCSNHYRKENNSGHPLYNRWILMKRRCHDKDSQDYKYYGARGIIVCVEWLESFQNFRIDMEMSYQPGLMLGRKDNDGPYCKDNCRWETDTEQQNNKTNNRLIKTSKGTLTISEAARAFGYDPGTIHQRIYRGCPLSEAYLLI